MSTVFLEMSHSVRSEPEGPPRVSPRAGPAPAFLLSWGTRKCGLVVADSVPHLRVSLGLCLLSAFPQLGPAVLKTIVLGVASTAAFSPILQSSVGP